MKQKDKHKLDSKSFSHLIRKKFPELEDFWASVSEGSIHLSTMVVSKANRNLGIGTKVMKYIIDFANQNNCDLFLTPDTSLGGSSRARLIKFYKRFGLVENKGRNKDYRTMETMHRKSAK